MDNFRNRLFLTKDEINAQPWTIGSTDLIKTLYVPIMFFANVESASRCFYGAIDFDMVNSSGTNITGSYTTAVGNGNSVYVGSKSSLSLDFGYFDSGNGYDIGEMFRGINVNGYVMGVFAYDGNSLMSHSFEDLYVRINAQELFNVPYIRYNSTTYLGSGRTTVLNGHIYYESA